MVEQRQKGGSAFGGHQKAKPSSCALPGSVCQTSVATSASGADDFLLEPILHLQQQGFVSQHIDLDEVVVLRRSHPQSEAGVL
jgi:hypothetical protein